MDQKRISMAKPYHDEMIENSVIGILRSGMLVQGRIVAEFEAKLLEYLGCKHIVAVNSGTAALHSAIASVRRVGGKGKPSVVTTPLSFSATANAIVHAGCVPIFIDVDEDTFNMDPSMIEEKITDDSIAIEPVDVYGLPCELDEIMRVARREHLAVIEDAAEAIGASYHGKKIGTISTLTCFSTYATKNLHTGEGGFVATEDSALAEQLRIFRNQGQISKYNHTIIGYNFRMQEVSASIGLAQIPLIDDLNSKRRAHALRLKDALSHIACLDFQEVENPSEHSWYMFALKLDPKRANITRDMIVVRLRERGIEADVAWPRPIHLQEYYRNTFGFKEGDFPIAEEICKRVFQLPIHPFLSNEDVDRVAATVEEILR